MRRSGGPALAAWVVVAAAVATYSTGCEQIRQWEGDAGDDGGEDGGSDAGPDAGPDAGMDAGNLGDGGTGAFLASFGPDRQFIRSPADVSPTYPSALTVGILRDGESGPVQVTIDSSDASVAGVTGGIVTVPTGSNSAVVPLTAREGGTVTLTATFDGGMLQATVTALPKLLLSEVAAANGIAAPDDEFVELYNPTAVGFSLAGYVVQYHSNTAGTPYLNVCTIPSGKRIAPFSFFLIGVNNFNRAEDTHDTWGGAGAFGGGAGTVRLGAPGIGTDAGDPLALDRVGWGGGAVDAEGTPVNLGIFTFGSIERKARPGSTSSTMNNADKNAGNAVDTDNNDNDWVTKGTQDPQTSLAPAEPPP